MSVIQNTNSPEWLALRKYCEERLVELREANDSPQPDIDTSILRGQIMFCKEVLELDKPDIPAIVPTTTYADG